MSSKRRRGRQNNRARLEKAKKEQARLEAELEKLSAAEDQKECAVTIRKFVESKGEDPMMSEENPFKHGNEDCCCCIL